MLVPQGLRLVACALLLVDCWLLAPSCLLVACCLWPEPGRTLVAAVAASSLMAWFDLLRAGELPEHARSSLTALRFANSFPASRNSL